MSIRWLIDEGIIRAGIDQMIDGDTIVWDAVLTAKGYQILGSGFYNANSNLTVAARTGEIRNSDGNWWQFGDLAGGVAGGFLKSLSGS